MPKNRFPKFILIMMLSASYCGMVFILDGNFYYNPWNAIADSNGCIGIDTNQDGTVDASIKKELSIVGQVMTVTATNYSDTTCETLSGTIVATSSFVTGNYIDAYIIYLDISSGEYSTWLNQPVSALTVDISYDTATLTCSTDACVTNYSALIALNNCSSGDLVTNQAYDYTACEFSGQPATLYTLAYKNSFSEIIFGTSAVLSTDSESSFAGDSADNRHKYLYANDRYVLK